MKVVGITGPTGAGKSTVCCYMKEHGCEVIDADEVAREILLTRRDCVDNIVREFSDVVLNPDKSINRSVLAGIAFDTKENVDRLNQIMYPVILINIAQRLFEYKKRQTRVVVIDAAQIFESNVDKLCDVVIAVLTPVNIRLDRIIQRDRVSESTARKRIEAQSPDEFYKMRTPYIINGSNSVDAQLGELFRHVDSGGNITKGP